MKNRGVMTVRTDMESATAANGRGLLIYWRQTKEKGPRYRGPWVYAVYVQASATAPDEP